MIIKRISIALCLCLIICCLFSCSYNVTSDQTTSDNNVASDENIKYEKFTFYIDGEEALVDGDSEFDIYKENIKNREDCLSVNITTTLNVAENFNLSDYENISYNGLNEIFNAEGKLVGHVLSMKQGSIDDASIENIKKLFSQGTWKLGALMNCQRKFWGEMMI